MPKKLRLVTFFVRRRNLQMLGCRRYAYTLGNRVQDFWFHYTEIKDPSKSSIKKNVKHTMQRVLGRQEKVVDYLGTFEGRVWNNAIFLVIYGEDAIESELIVRGSLERFYSQTNSTCKRMIHEVKQVMSVRYPDLYFRFVEMKNRVERERLNKIREKEDPHARVPKKNRFKSLIRAGGRSQNLPDH